MTKIGKRKDRPDDPYYYASVDGRRKRLTTQMRSSKALLADLQVKSSRRRHGVLDPVDEHKNTALADHLAKFETHLRAATGSDARETNSHVRMVVNRLIKAFKFMRAETIGDLSVDDANLFLVALMDGRIGDGTAKRPERPRSPKARDHYRDALSEFAEWAVDTGRLRANPFRKIKRIVTRKTRRAYQKTKRRPFTVEEFERTVEVALTRWHRYAATHPRAKPETLEKFQRKGQLRAMAYLYAGWTATRHDACRNLQWRDLDLTGGTPTVRLVGRYAKNKNTSFVPLVPWLVAELAEWRKTSSEWSGRPVRGSDPVFLGLPVHLERKLREDAILAGIEIGEDEVIDFHALKTTTATLCVDYGVHPRTAQKILQHSTLEQTMEVYAELRPETEHREASKLPTPSIAGTVGTAQQTPRSGSLGDALDATSGGNPRTSADSTPTTGRSGTC